MRLVRAFFGDLGRLAGPLGQAPGRDQPAHRLFQRVVVTLALRAQVLRARPLAQRLQHRGQRRGALRGQVTAQLPGAAEGRGQP